MMELISKNSYSKRVLILVRHPGHFDLFKPIASYFSSFCFTFFSYSTKELDFYKNDISSMVNAIWVNEIEMLKFKMESFDLFLTYDAQNVQGHKTGLEYISIAKKAGVPVGEMQHGLFQIGFNAFHEPSNRLFFDESIPSVSQADFFFSWFPCINDSITMGYPLYLSDQASKVPPIDNKTIAIFTNLHWKVFSYAERVKIIKGLSDFIESNPEYYFIWKRHHGEIQSAEVSSAISIVEGLSGRNFSDINNLKIIDDYVEINRLINVAYYCISTVSTILLDIEAGDKKTAVIVTDSTKNLMSKYSSYADFFKTNSPNNFKNLTSDYLLPFNPNVLVNFFKNLWRK